MNFEIDKKQIEIFYNETENKKIPVIILNTFSGEGNKVWEECKKLNAKDFILVAISKMSWSNDMTPWECPPLYKGDSYCKGYADEYLKLIEDEIIPKVEGFITNELQKEIERVCRKYGFQKVSCPSLANISSTIPDCLPANTRCNNESRRPKNLIFKVTVTKKGCPIFQTAPESKL